jgi:hypothetical protein
VEGDIAMTRELNEMQLAGLARNALLIAGQEMGETGDHWPAIKSTIHSIGRDWEAYRIEKDVDAEMKIHLYRQLEIMENELPNCSPEGRAELTPKLKELRELYDAYFSSLDETAVAPIREEETPLYVKRAETILATLGGEHD